MTYSHLPRGSQVVLEGKNPPAIAGEVRDTSLIPGWEDPLEEEMATHSNIPAWRIAYQKSLVGYSLRGRKESNMTEHTHTSAKRMKVRGPDPRREE